MILNYNISYNSHNSNRGCNNDGIRVIIIINNSNIHYIVIYIYIYAIVNYQLNSRYNNNTIIDN